MQSLTGISQECLPDQALQGLEGVPTLRILVEHGTCLLSPFKTMVLLAMHRIRNVVTQDILILKFEVLTEL